MRKIGQSQMLMAIAVGKSTVVDPTKVSRPSNLHNLAKRLGIKIATRIIPAGKDAGKLEIFRLGVSQPKRVRISK